MSWFQSGQLATFAKSALKEAQKTIDKALDINEESPTSSTVSSVTGAASDFFASWGVAVTSKYGNEADKSSEEPDDLEHNTRNVKPILPISTPPKRAKSSGNIVLNGEPDTITNVRDCTNTYSSLSDNKPMLSSIFSSSPTLSSTQEQFKEQSRKDDPPLRRSLTSDIPVELLVPITTTDDIDTPISHNKTSTSWHPTCRTDDPEDKFQSLWLIEDGKSSSSNSDRAFNSDGCGEDGQVEVLDEDNDCSATQADDLSTAVHLTQLQSVASLQTEGDSTMRQITDPFISSLSLVSDHSTQNTSDCNLVDLKSTVDCVDTPNTEGNKEINKELQSQNNELFTLDLSSMGDVSENVAVCDYEDVQEEEEKSVGGVIFNSTASEIIAAEESEVTVSSSSQEGWGWPSSDFADSVISADAASTLTNSSSSCEPAPLVLSTQCQSSFSSQLEGNILDVDHVIDGVSDPDHQNVLESGHTQQSDDERLDRELSSRKSQLSQSPPESVETSENEVEGEAEHDETDTSPKISSRATSSISVLSGASEKESTCPSSPALGGYANNGASSNSNSDSPSFEIISMHSAQTTSTNNKRISTHNNNRQHSQAPYQELFLPIMTGGGGGEGSPAHSNLPSSCSSSIANVSMSNSNSAGENCSSSSFERVECPHDDTSPEPVNVTKKGQHKKAASSASSSDIEVIPLDSVTDRKSCMSSAPQTANTYSQSEAETQTDFPPEEKEPATAPITVSGKMAAQVSEIIAEKDLEIEQLREEGEKLSKKQFELSNIIKKLRLKEKEMEASAKNLRNELSGKNAEVERLMKTFVAKEGIEQTQNENISRLTAERRKLQLSVEQLSSELEDSRENCTSMKNSLENASIEILELKNIISSAHRDSAELDSLTREKSELLSRNESLQKEVEHLRITVNATQLKASTRELELKSEINDLHRKVHNLEDQVADVSSEVADATMPLSLEIEKLQQELKSQRSLGEKREATLQTKIFELEVKLKGTMEREKSLKEMQETFTASTIELESHVEKLQTENKRLKNDMEECSHERSKAEQKLAHMSLLERHLAQTTAETERLKKENEGLTAELRMERSQNESERKRSQSLQDQLNRNQNSQQHHHNMNSAMTSSTISNSNQNNKSGENSPSSQSIISEVSYLDEVFDANGHMSHRSMTPKSFFDTFPSANFLETLQSQLRMREGEVIQFQEEVSKNEKIRKTLNDEIAHLTLQNQELLMRMESMNELQARMEEVDKNYNAVLQMYGEKVEESEELRLDLQDVKDMYKLQIEQLLKK